MRKHTISEIDECLATDPCAPSNICVNTPGSYVCFCSGSVTEPECKAGIDESFFFKSTDGDEKPSIIYYRTSVVVLFFMHLGEKHTF